MFSQHVSARPCLHSPPATLHVDDVKDVDVEAAAAHLQEDKGEAHVLEILCVNPVRPRD